MNSTHVFKSYNLPDFQVGKPKIIRHDIFSWLNLIRERGSFPTLPVGHFCVCYSRCTYRDDGGGGGVTVYLIRHLETTAMPCTMPFNGREKIPKWSVFTSSQERLLQRGRRTKKQDHSFFIARPISKLKIFPKNPRSKQHCYCLMSGFKQISLLVHRGLHTF